MALPLMDWLLAVESWVRLNPYPGAIVYVGLTVLGTVALVPGWIPLMAGGLLFGMVPGLVLGTIGVTVGATAAMLAGRTIARQWVAKRIAGNEQMLALDDALDQRAFVIVALTRFALVIPFNVLNYAYGLTRVDTRTYAAATLIGMLPVVALYVYLGTLARNIGQILNGDAQPGSSAWWLLALAAVALTVVIVVVRRTMKQILRKTRHGRAA